MVFVEGVESIDLQKLKQTLGQISHPKLQWGFIKGTPFRGDDGQIHLGKQLLKKCKDTIFYIHGIVAVDAYAPNIPTLITINKNLFKDIGGTAYGFVAAAFTSDLDTWRVENLPGTSQQDLVTYTLAHEILHALGVKKNDHSKNPASLMYETPSNAWFPGPPVVEQKYITTVLSTLELD